MTERLLLRVTASGLLEVSAWPAGELLPSPVGEPVPIDWPLDEEALAQLRWYLEEYLQAPFGVYSERGPRIAARLPVWGARIFDSVFGAGPARDAYQRARAAGGPLEIVLMSGHAQTLSLPWELMADPDRPGPLALAPDIALSRGLPTADLARVFTVPGSRLRVLMVISRPNGTADVAYRMIARPLLHRLEAVRGSVDLVVLRPPTLDRLREVLREGRERGEPFQIVHFDGHGAFGEEPPGGTGRDPRTYDGPGPQGMLAFERPDGAGADHVPAARVARVLAEAQVPVVVLNACRSAVLGARVEAAVATRLLQEGTAAVVAMAYSVYAVAAAEFMTAFYERLFAGDRLVDAVAAGRRRLADRDHRPSPKGPLPLSDWAVPVLYARSEVRFPGLVRAAAKEGRPGLDAILDRIAAHPTESSGQPDGTQDLVSVGEFVGRDALFYELEAAARHQRVVVLHGPGGTGKTELAKAFARWYRDTGAVDEPEWVFWQSFEPGQASSGLPGVLGTIGLRVFGARFALLDEAGRRAAVDEFLATRRALLIWDNVESVHTMPAPPSATPPLTTADLAELREFLTSVAGGGRSAVLLTSRTRESWLPEGPAGARRIEVGGLSREESVVYADQLLAPYPAARRRRAARSFGELMQWMDGHPLTMRLVLPHVDTTDAGVLLERLRGTAEGVRGFHGDEGTPTGDRTASLAAGITYSFDHLPADEQRALVAVCLFHRVADADVLELFSEHPLVPERFRERTAQAWQQALDRAADVGLLTRIGARTYRIHPALPGYLAMRWRAEDRARYGAERAAAEAAFLGAYADFGRWLREQLDHGEASDPIALMAEHQATMTALFGQALEARRWEHAGDLVSCLSAYWNVRGPESEARIWIERGRIATETDDSGPPPLDTAAGRLWLYLVGVEASRQSAFGRFDEAERTYLTVLAALEDQEPSQERTSRLAITHGELGRIAHGRGDWSRAEEHYGQATAASEQVGDLRHQAIWMNDLGTLAGDRGAWDEAESWFRASLTVMEEIGDQSLIAVLCQHLGMAARGRRRYGEAAAWLDRGLGIARHLGSHRTAAVISYELANLALIRGDAAAAERLLRDLLGTAEEIGDRRLRCSAALSLGRVAGIRGDPDEAEAWYRQSRELASEAGDRTGMVYACEGLATSREAQGDLPGTLEWRVRAVSSFEEFPHPVTEPIARSLRKATAEGGLPAVAAAWRAVTGHVLPPAVRAYLTTPPQGEDQP
ncbi:CHAT domain-containing protein [Streptomyces sp. NPDC051921]|uniref:CHAT domain-containing protein n=1 Tax=Streptomyces sp. NPDC051921 TaxID=3155806 RepID=UPI00342BAE5C